MKNPDLMTNEELQREADVIEKELAEHREELNKAMSELPEDFFDKMHDSIMEKVKYHEEQKAAERFLNFVFGDEDN